MKKGIEGATAVLVGKALWKWDRASNMATFEFGRKSQVLGTPGNVKEVGEWALDVQCAWRITRQDEVVVGSRDVYYPAEYDESKSIPSEFEWERDPNRRDK